MPLPTLQPFLSGNNPKLIFNPAASKHLAQIYDDSFNFFKNFDYHGLVVDLKTISIILSVIFGTILFVVMRKLWNLGTLKEELAELKGELAPPKEAVTAYDNRWQEIRSHVNSINEAEWKMAIVEGDKFVDDVLKTAGFLGESMGERLMTINPDQIINLQYLWDAHKLRNLLVHDPNFHLTHQQATYAINAFESVLRELGALT